MVVLGLALVPVAIGFEPPEGTPVPSKTARPRKNAPAAGGSPASTPKDDPELKNPPAPGTEPAPKSEPGSGQPAGSANESETPRGGRSSGPVPKVPGVVFRPGLKVEEKERIYDGEFGVMIVPASAGHRVTAACVIPIEWPEQSLEKRSEVDEGCRIRIEKVPGAGAMLVVTTEPLRIGRTVTGLIRYRIRVKTRPALAGLALPEKPGPVPKEVRPHFGSSPGIDPKDPELVRIAKELGPADQPTMRRVEAWFGWVHREIEYRMQPFTNTKTAVRDRIGDCEEKAAVFIAMCRSGGVPARLVWSPGHCWAEFHVTDAGGNGHWLPAHTAGPPWLGELGLASVILQKGDNLKLPGRPGATRVLHSWYRVEGKGAPPDVRFVQEIKPVQE
jgi:hypothetical protein